MKLKLILSIILAVATLQTVHNAYGDSGVFVGATYTQLDYKESPDELDFTAVGGLVGYNVDSTFGVELRHSVGAGDDNYYGYDVKLDSITSVLGRLSLQNDTNLVPYVVMGYSQAEMTIKGVLSDKADGLTYGAGVGFKITRNLSAGLEYTVYLDKADYDVTGAGANLIYKF